MVYENSTGICGRTTDIRLELVGGGGRQGILCAQVGADLLADNSPTSHRDRHHKLKPEFNLEKWVAKKKNKRTTPQFPGRMVMVVWWWCMVVVWWFNPSSMLLIPTLISGIHVPGNHNILRIVCIHKNVRNLTLI